MIILYWLKTVVCCLPMLLLYFYLAPDRGDNYFLLLILLYPGLVLAVIWCNNTPTDNLNSLYYDSIAQKAFFALLLIIVFVAPFALIGTLEIGRGTHIPKGITSILAPLYLIFAFHITKLIHLKLKHLIK